MFKDLTIFYSFNANKETYSRLGITKNTFFEKKSGLYIPTENLPEELFSEYGLYENSSIVHDTINIENTPIESFIQENINNQPYTSKRKLFLEKLISEKKRNNSNEIDKWVIFDTTGVKRTFSKFRLGITNKGFLYKINLRFLSLKK